MTSRRDFLKNTGLFTLGGLALGNEANALFDITAKSPAAGLQLFTLFRSMGEDPKGTLAKVAAIGYKEIESFFGGKDKYFDHSPKEFKQIITDLGMTWRSHHVGGAAFRPRQMPATPPPAAGGENNAAPTRAMGSFMKRPNLQDNMQQLVDEAAEGGVSYLVCASTPVGTLDEVKKSIEVFVKTGEACKKAGIQFAFHNHTAEFETVEGQKPYDLILSETDPDQVKMELDLGWASKAGVDIVALFKKNPKRFPLWHVKDITKGDSKPTEIGNGIVDFKPIFANAKVAGLKNFFIEQDMAPAPIENITTSFNNLKKVMK